MWANELGYALEADDPKCVVEVDKKRKKVEVAIQHLDLSFEKGPHGKLILVGCANWSSGRLYEHNKPPRSLINEGRKVAGRALRALAKINPASQLELELLERGKPILIKLEKGGREKTMGGKLMLYPDEP